MPDSEGGATPAWFSAALAQEPERGEVEVEGCPVRWLAWGERTSPTLVLVHGGAANAFWWTFIGPLLADEYRVVAPHLSGHGDSGWRDAYRTELWAEEVMAVSEAAGRSGSPSPDLPNVLPYVAGHSLGSQVTAVTAARHGDQLAGAVLIDFGLRERGERSQSAQRADRNYRDGPSRAEALARFRIIPWQPCDNDFVVRHIAEKSVVKRPDGRWGWKFDPDLFGRSIERYMGDYLADITVPVALIPGRDSRVVPPEITARAVSALGRPVPVVPIPAAHHHVMLDQPLAFVSALRAVLATWRAAGSTTA